MLRPGLGVPAWGPLLLPTAPGGHREGTWRAPGHPRPQSCGSAPQTQRGLGQHPPREGLVATRGPGGALSHSSSFLKEGVFTLKMRTNENASNSKAIQCPSPALRGGAAGFQRVTNIRRQGEEGETPGSLIAM